jgi:L-lactate dehydrogenase complex protein LldF
VYPGPIGAVLTPQLIGLQQAKTLPYASSLCGACYEVCPVAINIPEVLLHLRGKLASRRSAVDPERLAMRSLAAIFANPHRYERAQQLARLGQGMFVHGGAITRLPGPLAGWTSVRDLKPLPRQSFREWWREQKERQDTR